MQQQEEAGAAKVTVYRSDQYEAKLAAMCANGHKNLQVVVDFDSTLTLPSACTSWGLIEFSNVFSKSYHDTAHALFHKYHPIEVDHSLSMAEKIKAMEEWWDAANGALLAERPTRQTFPHLVQKQRERVLWRNGVDAFMRRMHGVSVPVLVFSAGLGDAIRAMMEVEGWNELKNTHVLSNFLVFDGEQDDAVATSFLGEKIHVFNKSEGIVNHAHPVWEAEVVERRNVLLVGDSLGDVHMSDGIAHDNVLKVGFVNKPDASSELIQAYRDVFDVVIHGLDAPFDEPARIAESILSAGDAKE